MCLIGAGRERRLARVGVRVSRCDDRALLRAVIRDDELWRLGNIDVETPFSALTICVAESDTPQMGSGAGPLSSLW